MSKPESSLYEFGEFQLDAARRLLLRQGEPVTIAPKVYEVLLALVETPGQPLSKDELLRRVWPDTVVEESNLTVSVSALRKVLGERRDEHQFIATLPGIGYQFVAPVSQLENNPPEEGGRGYGTGSVSDLHLGKGREPQAQVAHAPRSVPLAEQVLERQTIAQVVIEEETEAETHARTTPPLQLPAPRRSFVATRWLALGGAALLLVAALAWYFRREAPANSGQVRSLAVLPFTELGQSQADSALGLGMADTLISRLGSLGQIEVRPTAAIRRYAGQTADPLAAGRELRVEAVLSANLQRQGQTLRVTAQLVRINDQHTLWSDTLDEQATRLFTLQDNLSARLAAALALPLSARDRERLTKHGTANIEAYQLYLKGRLFWNRRTPEWIAKGIESFEQALQLDQQYALAWAGLADCYVLSSSGLPALERMPKAHAAVERALQLDEQLAEAHATRGLIKFKFDFDLAGAETAFQRAIELNPNYATTFHWYGDCLSRLDRFDEALRLLRQAERLDPLALALKEDIGTVYYRMRRYAEAEKQYRDVLAIDPGFARTVGMLALVDAAQGRYDEAVAMHLHKQELAAAPPAELSAFKQAYQQGGWAGYWRKYRAANGEKKGNAYENARLALRLGERARAYEWLEQSFADHSGIQIDIKNDPEMDPLRAEPRFQALLRRCGFAP
ncbi:MAG: winged helix-turn-helix domain-containing protein [Acidobacteria bacterium]|nr:winged helix-turn-helix domain-containing protein [Acidobacteriota bacterium]MBI3422166.1 winged helix-turn-helix domain-containing protein [Acidobacteriota bacterium]